MQIRGAGKYRLLAPDELQINANLAGRRSGVARHDKDLLRLASEPSDTTKNGAERGFQIQMAG